MGLVLMWDNASLTVLRDMFLNSPQRYVYFYKIALFRCFFVLKQKAHI